MVRMLELCSGENASWSKAARGLGIECVTLDWSDHCRPDLLVDVREFAKNPDQEGHFEIVAASPDCKELSKCRSTPGDVELSNETAKACVKSIEHFVAKGGKGFLENPQGALSRQEWSTIAIAE